MAKYSIIHLELQKGEIFKLEKISKRRRVALESKDVIYIYRGTKSKKVYIGQTINFLRRHGEHYNGTEEKFNTSDFDQVMVIYSEMFHISALNDVERELITYFTVDSAEGNGQEIGYNHKIINGNGGNKTNEYSGKDDILTDVIIPLWENDLYPDWVNTPKLEDLRAEALFKYSPIKKLTLHQDSIITEVLNNPSKNYVINGDAGTGKTVLLTHLVARILEEKPSTKIGVVVQSNWEKTAENIFKVYRMNSSNLTISTSTKLIKKNDNYDIIIVDESHRLSRKHGKQQPSFGSVYDNPEYKNCESHLEILQRMSNQIVLMYDVFQGIRPANITREMFDNLTKNYERKFLKTQFRIQTPAGKDYTSDDYINGIKYLLYKDTGILSLRNSNYNHNFNREIFRDKSSEDAYFGYFKENPLSNLIDWIDESNNLYPNYSNRILAGLVEPWLQSDGKNIDITHWHEGDIKRRWNSTQVNWVNSKDIDAKEQIGSVFAVQGIDLNYVGVLIGPDLEVDSTGKLRGNPDKFYNTNGTFLKSEMSDPHYQREFTLFVMNIYYVLLTRGIDGIRLGFWKNDDFLKYMEKTLNISC